MTNRIEKEKRIMAFMVRLYCSKKENNKDLCGSCKELIEYSKQLLDNCQYSNNKASCKRCPKHCYKKEYRDRIRKVMRFSGSRIIIHNPKEFLRHLIR